MNRRGLLGVLGLGAVAKLSDARADEVDQTTALAVRIVPTQYQERGGGLILLTRPSEHFHVVVTNVSGGPIRLWREWCSWGYYNLTFLVTVGADAPVVVKKQGRAWFGNWPDPETIPPGGHHVRDVTFDTVTWMDPPLPVAGGGRTVRMKAVFEIPTEAAKQHGVWTAKVSSPEEPYELRR